MSAPIVTCQHPGCPAFYGDMEGRPQRPPPGWYVRWQGRLTVFCPEHSPERTINKENPNG